MNQPSQDQARPGQSSAGDFVPDNLDSVAALLAERRTRNRIPLEGDQEPRKPATTRPSPDEPEQSEAAAEVEAADDLDDAEQPEEGQAEAESEESEQFIQLDGEEIPLTQLREWKTNGMLQADYSRKTQVLAEQSKTIRQMEEALTQAHFVRTREIDEATQVLDRRLAQFNEVDWYTMAQENPARASALREQREAIKEQRQALLTNRERYSSEWQQMQDYNLQQRAQAALPELKLRIKDWSDAKYGDLQKHVISLGAEPEVVGKIVEPWFWELVSDAMAHRKGKALHLKSAVPLTPSRTVKSGPSAQQRPKNTEADAIRAARKASSVRGQEDAVMAALRARRKR